MKFDCCNKKSPLQSGLFCCLTVTKVTKVTKVTSEKE